MGSVQGLPAKKVEKWYADQNRIPVEHAVLDDNGDGIFSDDPKPPENDGMLAQIAYLDLIPAKPTDDNKATAADSSVIRNLTAQVRELERSVFLLRNRKADLPTELYQQEMEESFDRSCQNFQETKSTWLDHQAINLNTQWKNHRKVKSNK